MIEALLLVAVGFVAGLTVGAWVEHAWMHRALAAEEGDG